MSEQNKPEQDNNPNEPKQNQEDQPQQKQIRRIAERGQIPTDKGELIQYLSNRIKEAEDALLDTQQLLESEVKEREKLTKSLEDRNEQLKKLYEIDQKGLPEKIKQKLNQILSETVSQKIQSEEKLSDEQSKNYEFKQRYEQIKWEDKNNKAKLEDQTKKEEELAKDISELENENAQCEQEIKKLEADFAAVKDKKQELENKYLQMKVALERMSDIKGVLNRFFSNEDLWDEKMDLKEQKVQRLPQPAKQLPPPSRQKQKMGNSRLKPITRPTPNGDEDFWTADFKNKY